MISLCARQFVECCKNHYFEQDLINVQVLTGYGALLCGTGNFAAYKLEVKLNEEIQFIT